MASCRRGKRSTRPAPPPPKVAPVPAPRALDLRLAIVAVVALAALVRLAATWNDLWLDEIWTLNLLGTLHSPLEILTSLHHDNNHVLNSFFLYLLKPLGSDWLYRLPALLAGIATVGLGAWLATLDDVPATTTQSRALMAAIVLGVSLPLIQYGSEARGYAMALAFGLAAIALAVRDDVRPMSASAPAVWALLVLAFLSHALALHVMTGLAAWAAVRAFRRDGALGAIGTLAWWFAVPFAAFGAFWWWFLRGITVGGSNREGIGPPLARALATVSGLPGDVPLAVSLVLVLGVAAAGLWVIAQRKSDLWVLFVIGMIVSPIALAIANPTNNYAERYFLVSMLLWLLLLAQLLAWLVARGGPARIAALVALAVFGVANGARVADLLRDGRWRVPGRDPVHGDEHERRCDAHRERPRLPEPAHRRVLRPAHVEAGALREPRRPVAHAVVRLAEDARRSAADTARDRLARNLSAGEDVSDGAALGAHLVRLRARVAGG
jgi:hypothetical protein